MDVLHQAIVNYLKIDNKFDSQCTIWDLLQLAGASSCASQLLLSGWQRLEVTHWVRFSVLQLAKDKPHWLSTLESALTHATYLVGQRLTLADISVWAQLQASARWSQLLKSGTAPQCTVRYCDCVAAELAGRLGRIVVRKSEESPGKFEEGGKFKELEGGRRGEVVVRFPPEASGYLHVGHAKAALLNAHYRDTYNGRLILRFDDTNPAKETAEFEQVIQEDVKTLGIKYDHFSHTSDHFDKMLELCEQMIRQSKAYADDTEPELVKAQRERREESANRSNSVDKNLSMWKQMLAGTEYGQKCCIRAKIDMASDNGCLRDPTIYRCKSEPHLRTGYKYKVYPTYDFACPIVDSLEGVTHALRTLEYKDRDAQYYWFIEALGLRKPLLEEFSRLALQHTVLSKRRLTWFVNEGLVEGWNDPRFPTVRGIVRRGMTVEGLRQFILAQGFAKSNATMEWDKLWAFNKKVIDPVAPRYTALLNKEKVLCKLVNFAHKEPQATEAPLHPKNGEIGNKTVWQWSQIFVEGADAESLSEGEIVTLINWGNARVLRLHRVEGRVTELEAELRPDDKDFKKTQKLTWLAHLEQCGTLVQCVHCDHLISKPIVGKDEDFRLYVNRNSLRSEVLLGDQALASLKKGDIVQLQRRGFFICDSPAGESEFSHVNLPCRLLAIPDGHQKEMPTAGSKHKQPAAAKQTSSKKPKQQQGQQKQQQGQQKGQQKQQQQKSPSSLAVHVDLLKRIQAQGDQVRRLKTEKADKDAVQAAVSQLLSLKAEFKQASGREWQAQLLQEAEAPQPTGLSQHRQLLERIAAQGELVRQLKAKKAEQSNVKQEVDKLLALKAEFKSVSGLDHKPDMLKQLGEQQQQPAAADGRQKLLLQIKEQGDRVRTLKSEKAEKAKVQAAVDELLKLKAKFKEEFKEEWTPKLLEASSSSASGTSDAGLELLRGIKEVGDRLRALKAAKADKASLQPEIDALQSLKAKFKAATGAEYKPDMLQQLAK